MNIEYTYLKDEDFIREYSRALTAIAVLKAIANSRIRKDIIAERAEMTLEHLNQICKCETDIRIKELVRIVTACEQKININIDPLPFS